MKTFIGAEGWIVTYTGKQFSLQNIDRGRIDIRDIAHALSMTCRFGGHVEKFYSVAQHSVLVSRHVPSEYALEALLHDGAEAYLVDMPSPIKAMLPGYAALEDKVQTEVYTRFNVFPDHFSHAEVKRVDKAILLDETKSVFALHNFNHPMGSTKALGIDIDPLPPEEAKVLFLDRFAELTRS